MPHATLLKFGYPSSVIFEGDFWAVTLRPAQTTLGALVVICKEEATAFSGISKDAALEFHQIVSAVERTLLTCFHNDKINWLMLMMVDPQVHFHVIPRYEGVRQFQGQSFADPGWPGVPDLGHKNSCDDLLKADLIAHLRASWVG
ncbi:HIT family protein [Iodidimonas gelatinilytica]|uniref:HIT family protein n=1 Tax=Iodidimonas gelatinilytica TaxID=1236966 RepID=A0A5A7MU86_9PROT|nr:HIT family protein [Iodidimonas gelatinilytica]GEQ99471.1 HIT family protein [Iodidimonas gelatinilytica]